MEREGHYKVYTRTIAKSCVSPRAARSYDVISKVSGYIQTQTHSDNHSMLKSSWYVRLINDFDNINAVIQLDQVILCENWAHL